MTTWNIKSYITLTQCNPLFEAIRDMDLTRFEEELVNVDVNYRTPQKWTALIVLAKIGNEDVHIRMMKLLLKIGADPNLQDNYGCAPLHTVSYNSRTESMERMMSLLLRAGADLNMQDNYGYTVLQYALCSETKSMERTVSLLLRAGADPNIQDNNRCTVLHFVSLYFTEKRMKRIMELLLRAGAIPHNEKTKEIRRKMLIRKARQMMALKFCMGFHLPEEFYDQISVM